MMRFILFCLLVLSNISNAQLLGGPNAEWWYEKTALGPPYYYHFWLGQDTVIQGRNCQTILGTEYQTNSMPPPDYSLYLSGTYNREPYYVASSGDTLLYFTNNQFYIQNIFGAPAGTQWECAPALDTCHTIATVIDTNIVLQNGITLHSSIIRKTNCYGNVITQAMNERVGGMADLLFPYFWIAVDTNATSCDVYRLNCYTDSDISVSAVGDCDGTLLGLAHIAAEKLQVFPNPTTAKVQISGIANSFSYTIHNATGQLVGSKANSTSTIDLSTQPQGLYLLTVIVGNNTKSFKIIKK